MKYFYFIFLIFISQTCLSNVNVAPVVLTLRPHENFVKVELTNTLPHKRHYHASLKSWSQVNGKEVYKDVSNWVISPPIFSIEPLGKQLIRLAPSTKITAETETSFRLFLTEIPDHNNLQNGQIKMILNISLPVFIESSSSTKHVPKINIKGSQVTIHNPNNHHIALGHITSNNSNIPIFGYVLAGQTKKFNNIDGISKGAILNYGYMGERQQINLGG